MMCEYTTWRGRDCCTCLATWLPVLEELAQSRGDLSGDLDVLQLRGSNPASSGTHAAGGVFDLGYYHDGQADDLVYLARQMGADATWFREWDGNHHVHGVLTGCPRNDPAAYQIEAVKDGYNGLGYAGQEGPDDGPRPLSGRTWIEGIDWAEDQMTISDDDVQRIANAVWNTKLQYEGVSDATAEAHLTNANMRARDLQLTAKPAQVWTYGLTRDGNGPWSSGSWLTQAGTAADEVRDDVNELAASASEMKVSVSGMPTHTLVSLVAFLCLLLGAALTLGILR